MATGVTGFPAALDTDATLLVQANDCSSLLSSSINATDTSLTVSNASSFPSAGILRIDDEFVKWDSKSTNTLNSLTRGAYGSTAASHAAAAEARLTVMAGYHNVLKDALIAVETKLGTGSSTASANTVLRGTGSGATAFGQIVSADITASTIANSRLAQVATATFKGRTTAGTGDVEDLTATQATALLNAMVGDSGSGGTKGLVPAPSAGDAAAGKYLKADGTFAVPPGTAGSGLNPTGSSTTNGDITLVGQAVSGGDVLLDLTPASSSAVAAEVPNFILRAATTTTNATVADFSFAKFLAPTLASNSARTTTNSATVYIANAPTAGTNMTITNPYALWVDDGNVRLDGFLGVGTTAPATTQFYVKAQSSGNVAALIDSAAGSGVNILQVRRDTTDVFVLNNVGLLAHSPVASTGTTPRANFITAAETGLGTTTENPWMRFGGDSSGSTVIRQWNAGTVALQRENIFVAPTYAFASASTMTDAITVDIASPIAGTNATLTRSTGVRIKPSAAAHHGLWVDGPISYTGDALALGQSGSKIVRFVGSGGTINNVLKADGALASNATDGFTYLGEYAATGPPTGTPTSYTGAEPVVFQRDNINAVYDLWTYSNSAWRSIGGQYKRYDTSTGTGAQTIDFNSSGAANVTRVFTFGSGNATFTFSNPPSAGSLITIVLVQDGSGGSRTATWPASVKWVGGSAPTLTTATNAKDVFQFVWTGSEYLETGRNLDVK